MDPAPNFDVPQNAGPGVYLVFDAAASGASARDPRASGRFKMNLLATMGADGTADPYKTIAVTGVQDVAQRCGKRSGARRGVERILAQWGSGLDLFVTPVPMSGGSAATYSLTPVLLGNATAAVGNDQLIVSLNDVYVFVDVKNGDSPTTISTNLKAQVAALSPSSGPGSSCPLVPGNLVGAKLPFTWAQNGAQGGDHPVATWIGPNLSGFGMSPGLATFADIPNAGTGQNNGIVTVSTRTKTVTATGIASGTSKEDLCAAVVAAINADSGGFPCRAQQRAGALETFDFILKDGRVAQNITITLNAAIGPVTVTVTADSAGSGSPNLAPALSSAAAADPMMEWVTEFTDATSLGTITNQLRNQGDGYRQREQFLSFALTQDLATAGALVAAVSPSLIFEDNQKATPGRMHAGWCPGAYQTGFDLACHRGAARAGEQLLRNFNGYVLRSADPYLRLTLPDQAERPDPFTVTGQARTTYFLSPYVVRSGSLLVESDVTTYGGSLAYLRKSTHTRLLANYRQSLLDELSGLTATMSVTESPALLPEVIVEESIKGAVSRVMHRLQDANLFDGADRLKGAIQAKRLKGSPGIWLIYAPYNGPWETDQLQGRFALA